MFKKMQALLEKMWQFHLNMNIEVRFDIMVWRHE